MENQSRGANAPEDTLGGGRAGGADVPPPTQNLSEEGWRALYQMSEARQRSGVDWADVAEVCLRAHQRSPDPAEALYEVGVHYRARGALSLAYVFLKRAMRLRADAEEETPAGRGVNDYALPLEYASCCFQLGEHGRAVEVYNSLMYGNQVPPSIFEQALGNREPSLEALYPKVPSPPSKANKIKVCVPFHNPGPALEKCVISVLNQDYQNFEVVFIDDASDDSSRDKIPQGDGRVALMRNTARRGWTACLRQCLTRHSAPGDIIFPLDASGWLVYCDVLTTVNEFFNSYDCSVMYGQYKYVTGQLGLTVPLTTPEISDALREAGHVPTPFIFRCRLYHELTAAGAPAGGETFEEGALYYALLGRCGLARARFSSQLLTVVSHEGRVPAARAASNLPDRLTPRGL